MSQKNKEGRKERRFKGDVLECGVGGFIEQF
jgi:hypothetical protein